MLFIYCHVLLFCLWTCCHAKTMLQFWNMLLLLFVLFDMMVDDMMLTMLLKPAAVFETLYICHATYVLLLGLRLNDNDACMMMNIVADEYACCCPCQTINSAQNSSHNAMLLLLFVSVETACWNSCYAVVWFSWVMFCLMMGWNHVCGLHKMPCCVRNP